ncbi:hypothetical protein Tsubulata_014664, partial [Turnera subulata]
CLYPEPYPEANTEFLKEKGIRLFQFEIKGYKVDANFSLFWSSNYGGSVLYNYTK